MPHTTIDITAQVIAEQALRLSREEALRNTQMADEKRAYLSAVLRAASVSVFVLERALCVLHRNLAHEAMFGPSCLAKRALRPVSTRPELCRKG